jgi:hypothetical protein
MFVDLFGKEIKQPLTDEDPFSFYLALLSSFRESARLSPIGKRSYRQWPLARFDVLEKVLKALHRNVPWVDNRPLYFFLDDYTIPTVPRNVQQVLNSIIFRRSPDLFFKVATESTTSFAPVLRDRKPLELHQDFELIDLGTESLRVDDDRRRKLLEQIFRPRIDRHPAFRGTGLG